MTIDCILTGVELTTPEGVTVLYTPQIGPPIPGAGIEDGPHDGVTYGRRDGAWTPVGSGAGLSRVKTAAATISGHRIVRDTTTGIAVVDVSDPQQADDVLGMTTGAIAIGASGLVAIDDDITEPSWAWTPLSPVYVTGMGLLTQSIPTTPDAFVMCVGYALSPTSMRVRIGIPVLL